MTLVTLPAPEEVQIPSYRGAFLVALLLIACLVATFGGWGMYARLDSAVVSHGVLLAESQRKTVEHLEGGILRQLLVKDGDRVAKGQVVALLDATQVEQQLAQLRASELTLTYEIWRLENEERGDTDAPATLDPATAPREPVAGREGQIAAQAALYDARRRAYLGQRASLERQVDQLTAQSEASAGRVRSAERALASWAEERSQNATLVAKGATPRQKLLEYDRNIALLEGDRDENANLVLAAREDIARARADLETLRQQRLVDIGERLAEDRRQFAEYKAQIGAALDVLDRKKLRAPQSGVVVHIFTVTPGAVVGSGVPVMEIVPDGDRLIVEAQLPPDTIDTVHVGRKAKVRLTAYKRAKAPTLEGEVIYVSADLLEDEREGTTYFDARIALDPMEVAALKDATLTAGMPVEVAIQTGERRAGEYFLEPFLRHLGRALHEE